MRRVNLRNMELFATTFLCIIFLRTSKGLPTGGGNTENTDMSGDGFTEPIVCNTTPCEEKAAFIRSILNESVDPCNNFYDYVCQNWKAQHDIPEDKGRYGMFDEVREKLRQEIKAVLGNASNEDKNSVSPKIRGKLLSIYQSCMTPCNESTEVSALKAVMKGVGIAKWPVFSPSEDIPDWNTTLANIMSKLNLNPIFEVSVAQDPKNVSQYGIQLDQVSFGAVGRNQLLNQTDEHNAKLIKAYKEYIKATTKLLADGSVSDAELQTFADQVVNFETELANRSRPEEERRDYLGMYNKKTVRELQHEVHRLNWLEFLNKLFHDVNITIENEEPVVIWEIEYYKSALEYLETVNKSMVHNYFGLYVTAALGPYTGDTFMNLTLQFQQVASGITKKEEQWAKCIGDLHGYMDHALGRLYVEKMFTENAKKEMDIMVSGLLKTFRSFIENKYWMDNETKREALNKVDSIGRKIAYPDWLMDDIYLDEKYKYVKDVAAGTPYVTIVANLKENHAKKSQEHLRQPYNKTTKWYMGAAVINAYYNPGSNDIAFPAGILQAPFYQYGLPLSLNMGAIGVVIGHEVTHAFDDRGSQFNAEGQLHNWWSNDTRKKFTERAKCFVRQYGNITDIETSEQLNGVNTQGENIADNGGLRGAFVTYKRMIQTDYKNNASLLPGLSMTSDQLFFVSNAIVWCQNIREATLRKLIQYDYHSPARYRITVPFSNLPEFSEAFNCAAGTPMNRTQKCKVW